MVEYAQNQPYISRNRRRLLRKQLEHEQEKQEQEKPKKMTGPGFWIMVMLALIKDFLDIAITILAVAAETSIIAGVAAGIYTDSVIIGTVVGFLVQVLELIPGVGLITEGFESVLVILITFMGFFSSVFISFIFAFYFIWNRVSFTTRKLVTFSVSVIIELIPLFGLIPTFTISLFLIRKFENDEHAKRKAQNKFLA